MVGQILQGSPWELRNLCVLQYLHSKVKSDLRGWFNLQVLHVLQPNLHTVSQLGNIGTTTFDGRLHIYAVQALSAILNSLSQLLISSAPGKILITSFSPLRCSLTSPAEWQLKFRCLKVIQKWLSLTFTVIIFSFPRSFPSYSPSALQ